MHAEQINSMIEKIVLEFRGAGGGLDRGDLRERKLRDGEDNHWKEWSLKFAAAVKEANPEIYDGLKWAESQMDEVTLDAVKNRVGDQGLVHSTMIKKIYKKNFQKQIQKKKKQKKNSQFSHT